MAAPEARVTTDAAHGIVVALPLKPTQHERARAHRARRHLINVHTLAALAACTLAWLTTNNGTTRWTILTLLAATVTASAAATITRTPRCSPRSRWVCHTSRDLPGLADLIGHEPRHFVQAMRQTDPTRYNTHTFTAAVVLLATLRKKWTQRIGSVLKADQLRDELIHAWKPVRDQALNLELGDS